MQLIKQNLLKYYSNPTIQKIIYDVSVDREFVPSFVDSKGNRKMGARPNILNEVGDIYSYVARGSNEFHISIERWSDVLSLGKNKTKEELDNNRKDWDFIIDIDVDSGFSYAKIIANEIFLFLVDEKIPIKDISVKFSGNKGFHIGLRGEEFPKEVPDFKGTLKKRSLSFPFLPLFILSYIEEKVSDRLKQKYLQPFQSKPTPQTPTSLVEQTTSQPLQPKSSQQPTTLPQSPFANLKLDFQVFSSRHFIRAPYSLHPKSGYVSLPIFPTDILSFKKEQATPEAVLLRKDKDLLGFLDNYSAEKAKVLVSHAFEWFNKKNKEEQKQILDMIKQEEAIYNQNFAEDLLKINAEKRKDAYVEIVQHGNTLTSAPTFFFNGLVDASYFPPTINNILKGLRDGKKRALFILINFFRSLAYSQEQIEKILKEWNLRNLSPLSEKYLFQQIYYNFKHKKPILPPSFTSNIYKDLGVYEEDELTKKVKNPVSYVYSKLKYKQKNKKKEVKKKEHILTNAFAIEEKYFPPTINNLLAGLSYEKLKLTNSEDFFVMLGQAANILINFFRQLGENVSSFYSQDQIKIIIDKWNHNNIPPYPADLLAQKIYINFMRKKSLPLPPLNSEIYKKLKVYEEDELIKKVKNPITYVKKKLKEDFKKHKKQR